MRLYIHSAINLHDMHEDNFTVSFTQFQSAMYCNSEDMFQWLVLSLGDFSTISLSQNLVPSTISDIILFHSSCLVITNINYLDGRMEVYV